MSEFITRVGDSKEKIYGERYEQEMTLHALRKKVRLHLNFNALGHEQLEVLLEWCDPNHFNEEGKI